MQLYEWAWGIRRWGAALTIERTPSRSFSLFRRFVCDLSLSIHTLFDFIIFLPRRLRAHVQFYIVRISRLFVDERYTCIICIAHVYTSSNYARGWIARGCSFHILAHIHIHVWARAHENTFARNWMFIQFWWLVLLIVYIWICLLYMRVLNLEIILEIGNRII